VQWVVGEFAGAPRCYQLSHDRDGVVRLWEAFTSDRSDNGAPIPCVVETKVHVDFSETATGLDLKSFAFGEVTLGDVLGDVDLSVFFAGVRGKYKPLISGRRLVAAEGSIRAGEAFSAVATHRPQTRVIRTPEVSQQLAACSSEGVESSHRDWIDIGFSLLIRWEGQAGLRSYRLFVDPFEEPSVGKREPSETGLRVLAGSVCGE